MPWPPPPPEGPVHRSLDGLAAALTVLLAASAAATLAAGAEAAVAASFWAAGVVTMLLLYLLVIPVFLVWFYRARKNADGRGQEQRRGPGWTIGGWIVPIISLFFPFQIMADIWRANLPAEQRTKTARLPGFWWGCWIAGGIIEVIANASARPAPGPARVGYFLSHLSIGAAAILLIVIVRSITRGPVGREPVAAQTGLAPQGWAAPGPAYPPWPADGRRRNRRAAGWGYALSALAVVIAGALTAGAYILPPRTTPGAAHRSTPASATPGATVEQLRTGDCIQGPADVNTGNTFPDVVSVVPCAKKHLAEVFYSANYWPLGTAFPENSVINRQAQAECKRAFRAYDGISSSHSQYFYYFLSPHGLSDWNAGDRQLVCVAFLGTGQSQRGVPLFGSIKDSFQ